MSVPISDRLFIDYLQCEYKAYLKLSGKTGVRTDFEKFQDKNQAEYRQRAREHLLITGRSTAPPAVNSTFKDVKIQRLSVAIDISISNDKYSLIIDAAELVLQPPLRKPVYNPIIFLPHQKISKQHKLLLAFCGAALSYEQKAEPISGRIIFGDRFSSAKGYVWVFSNMEVVVYLYRETREGSVLKEMLDGFNGVLISDFYTAYDSIPCPQQKCLIHLIRDINEDILRNPFDEELKDLGRNFTQLLSPIIETVDAFGLKRRHLNKHKSRVHGFFNKIEQKEFKSEVTNNFQRRLLKYRDKLFTFLNYDGVPWNNNNAEYAIKHFVYLRDVIGGTSTAKGIHEYLVLLSICETLRLRNTSFLKFLISGATDIDKFLEAKTNRLT